MLTFLLKVFYLRIANWLMTPTIIKYGNISTSYLVDDGKVKYENVIISHYVVPISLKLSVAASSGTGIYDNPYIVE